jgi:hypothetical protein
LIYRGFPFNFMELLQKEKNMKILVDFRNPLPFRRLSAKPPRRKRLRGLG